MIRMSVRAAAAAALLVLAGQSAAARELRTTVAVGKVNSRSLRAQLAARPQVVVEDPAIARAWFDADRYRLRVEGLAVGTTVVTFTGAVRVFNTGIPGQPERRLPVNFAELPEGERRRILRELQSLPVEGSRPVEDRITVTVVPAEVREAPAPRPVARVAPNGRLEGRTAVGRSYRFDLRSVARFWRDVEVASSDPAVARATVGADEVVATGKAAGASFIVISGWARNGGANWQQFTRRIDLAVVPAVAQPAPLPLRQLPPLRVRVGQRRGILLERLLGVGASSAVVVTSDVDGVVSTLTDGRSVTFEGQRRGRAELTIRGILVTPEGRQRAVVELPVFVD